MGERITRVVLEAEIAQFEQAMNRASSATKQVSDEGKKLAETHQAMTMLGTGMLVAGAAIAAGVGMAIAKYAEFDQAMSNVAATGDDARENMEALREAALDAGASTVFSATESANAIEELAKAGLSAKDILGGGLKGSLDLAAAGGLEVADAAGIAATALNVFNLEGEDMAHVADLLAAGAGKAMGDVSDLGSALQQSGQVAAATGLSLEETTATLAAFASQGLLGSDAGTSFKTMLQRLTPQSAEAAAKMDELGISAYDASGNFIGMEAFAGNLRESLKDLTPEARNAALSVMFGSDAVRGANVLYSEGEKGIRDWISAVDDQGYAAETAATRLDNLMGDWEAFTGALDTAFISMGEAANGPLRDLVQGLTGAVDVFNDLPEGGKQAVLWIGLVTAGVGLLGGATLIAIPKIAAFNIAMTTLGITGASTRAGLARFASFMTGPWGIALVAATAVIVGLSAAQDKLRTSTEVFQNVIKNAESADELFAASDSALPFLSRIKEATASAEVFQEKLDIIAHNDFMRGVDGAAGQLKNSLSELGSELAKTAETDAPAAARSFKLLSDEMKLSKAEQIDLLNTMGPYRDALVKQADAQKIDVTTKEGQIDMNALLAFALSDTADASATAADAYMAEADEVSSLRDELSSLIDMMNEANGVGQDAVSQNIAYQETLAAVNQAIAEGAWGLDISTEAGRTNMDMLVGLAADSQAAAQAQFELDNSTEGYVASMAAGREALINSAIAMGYTQEEAVALADKIYAIPTEKEIAILADTETAASKLDDLKARLDSIPNNSYKRVTLEGFTVGNFDVTPNENGNLFTYKQFANGGMNSGIYPGGAEIHKFAEKTLPWEAYISPKSDQRTANYGTWLEVGDRLGFQQQGSQMSFPDSMSISGRLELGTDGVARLVDGRLSSYDANRKMSTRGGGRPI